MADGVARLQIWGLGVRVSPGAPIKTARLGHLSRPVPPAIFVLGYILGNRVHTWVVNQFGECVHSAFGRKQMRETRHAFQQKVRERGQALRQLAYDRLATMNNEASEHVIVGTRTGTIATFCQVCDAERVAVVLRGHLDTWLPGIKNVARDGFYKHRNGSITDMPDDELYAYDPLVSN